MDNSIINELKTDFYTYKENMETPIFYRLKFSNTNIYLTKSTFESPNLGSNQDGYYRIFAWNDIRAREFLKFEFSDTSPNLGEVSLIGSFNPLNNDLQDIQYTLLSGKHYFKSASDTIANLGNTSNEIIKNKNTSIKEIHPKINIDNFSSLSEIIPTGAQGKAIYGKHNYIIDGPAGSGKSTTILQKIKLLIEQDGINNNMIVVILKNDEVKQSFKSLLSKLNVQDVRMYLPHEYLNILSLQKEAYVSSAVLIDIKNLAQLIKKFMDTVFIVFNINTLYYSEDKVDSLNEMLYDLNDIVTIEYLKNLKLKMEAILLLKEERNKKLSVMENEKDNLINSEKVRLKTDISNSLLLKNRLENGIMNIESNYDKLRKKTIQSFNIRQKSLENELDSLKDTLFVEYYSKERLSRLYKIEYINLLYKYCNDLNNINNEKSVHTIIIDEAQDISLVDLELIRLHTKNLILTGDEFQVENPNGLKKWNNILDIETNFYQKNNLNIYYLRHNFRQTYELGNASYNYRQVSMNNPILDITSDYFSNQKGYNKPRIVKIKNKLDFANLISEKIAYIREKFTTKVPLVIFYENKATLELFVNICSTRNYTYTLLTNGMSDNDILFVNLKNIAGREFPVVISPLLSGTSKNTIYVMLSRAKFDLTLVLGNDNKLDSGLEKLVKKKIITIQGY